MAERVLITGASGFSGGHLATEWSAVGAEVVGISRRGTCVAGEAQECDLLDPAAIARIVESFKPTVVHHLAALSSTGRSWQEPVKCISDNQATTWNLLEAVRSFAPEATVVTAGSGEGYGSPLTLPVTEDHPLAPGTPYAVAKTVADLIAGLFAHAHGLRVIRARAFNHPGPGQGRSFLLGSICSQAAAQDGSAALTIRTGTASIARDYCDVRDAARAYRLLAQKAEPGIYNICSGSSSTTAELVDLLAAELAPADVVHEVDPELVRPHETELIVGERTKLTNATGWVPEIPLSQTVADTLAAALSAR
jgi:GDP-4-dehydro-6-deoxy-D-mannose reductase